MFDVVKRRRADGRDTTIVIRGDTDETHVRWLAEHVAEELDAPYHLIDPVTTDDAFETIERAEEGETVIVMLGRLLEPYPPILQAIAHAVNRMRYREITWIFVTPNPPERAMALGDFEITPRVVGDVKAIEVDPFTDGTVPIMRKEMDPIEAVSTDD